jgi:hypothetical protein
MSELERIWGANHPVIISGGDAKVDVEIGSCELEVLMDHVLSEEQSTGNGDWSWIYTNIQQLINHAQPLVGPNFTSVFSKANHFMNLATGRHNLAWACMAGALDEVMNKRTAAPSTVWPWKDEWAVEVGGANHGRCVANNNYDALRRWSHWLGKPLGLAERVVNAADFDPVNSLIANSDFDTSPVGTWQTNRASVSHELAAGVTANNKSLRITPNVNNSYPPQIGACWAQLPGVALQASSDYTLCMALRSDGWRMIQITLGNLNTLQFYVRRGWNTVVLPWRQNNAQTSNLRIACGVSKEEILVDRLYLFKSYGAAVRRKFERGIAVLKYDNLQRTVDLGGTYNHLLGTQDPAMNNGAKGVTSVTFTANQPDGCLLITP